MKTRLTAAGLHFLISALVISLFLSVVYFIWYPEPFHTIHSVFDAVKIALAVDLVLGPFLTLVIFNVLKPRSELIRDISIIILIQISALTWGVHITHKMRPVFLVFQADTFYSIIKEDINLDSLNENSPPPAFWQQPEWVYIDPLSSEEAIQRMDDVAHGKQVKGEMYQASKYRPLPVQMNSVHMQDILKHTMSGSKLLNTRTWGQQIEQFLQKHNGMIEDYLFYPVINPGIFDGIIVFNKKDFSFISLIK